MSIRSLEELFLQCLGDLQAAESLVVKVLPGMAKNAWNRDLGALLETELVAARSRVQRLEQIAARLGAPASEIGSPGMAGVVREIEMLTEITEFGPTLDAALIGCARAVAHYRTTRYGTLMSWANALGFNEAAGLLHKTLVAEMTGCGRFERLAELRGEQQAA